MANIEVKSKKRKSGLRAFGVSTMLAAALFLAGCQSELYTNLQEREVNEMIAVLAANGISASRTSNGKGSFGLSVDRSKFSTAIATLSEKGLPRQEYGSLGKMFNTEKLVSTPFEERARFMHALNEELANSITRINGVVSARVHIMVPEDSPFESNKTPPRASVFIYQEQGLDLHSHIPTIKNLIVNSLDNLEYSNVEVALFDDANAVKPRTSVASTTGSGLWNIIILGLLAALVWFGFTFSSEKKSKRSSRNDQRIVKQNAVGHSGEMGK